jgi:hypothetical protein
MFVACAHRSAQQSDIVAASVGREQLRRSVACVVNATWAGRSSFCGLHPGRRSITEETVPKELRVRTACESLTSLGKPHSPFVMLKIFDSTLQAREFSPLDYLAGLNRVPVKRASRRNRVRDLERAPV